MRRRAELSAKHSRFYQSVHRQCLSSLSTRTNYRIAEANQWNIIVLPAEGEPRVGIVGNAEFHVERNFLILRSFALATWKCRMFIDWKQFAKCLYLQCNSWCCYVLYRIFDIKFVFMPFCRIEGNYCY